MIILASTSDILKVVTGSAANVLVHATWVDNASGSITPGRTNTAAITTATTTTVVGSPGSSTQRTVETLTLRNTSNSTSTTVKVQHDDGTNVSDLTPTMTLLPGESLMLDDHSRWSHILTTGGRRVVDRTPIRPVLHATWLAESLPRELCPEAATSISTNTGVLCPIFLRAGTVVTNVLFHTSSTAAGTPTHWQFGLYSLAGVLLTASADQATAAIAANTLFSLAMAPAYTVQTTGLYYTALSIAATTVPTWKSWSPGVAANLMNGFAGVYTLWARPSFSGGVLAPLIITASGNNGFVWSAVS